jgi:outer membrane protein assembly factor BamE
MMMRKLLINIAVIASLGLTGCSYTDERPDDFIPPISKLPGIYRIPIQQGNLITQEMINELKPGMTKQQVRFLLGTPLLVDTFNEDHWDYLYTNRPGSKLANTEIEKKRLKLEFENGRLTSIVGDMYPQGEELARITKEENREKTIVIPADAPRDEARLGIIERIVHTATGTGEKPIPRKAPSEQPTPSEQPAPETQE